MIKGARHSHAQDQRSGKGQKWEFRLYIADQTLKSRQAYANLKQICDDHLAAKYRIEVIDLLKKPQLAKRDQIWALPTLIRTKPEPVRTLIGNLSPIEFALAALDLRPGALREAM